MPRTSSTKGSNPNLYDVSGLIAAAQPFALEELQDIEQRKKASAEKLARKRPRLAVVKSSTALLNGESVGAHAAC